MTVQRSPNSSSPLIGSVFCEDDEGQFQAECAELPAGDDHAESFSSDSEHEYSDLKHVAVTPQVLSARKEIFRSAILLLHSRVMVG